MNMKVDEIIKNAITNFASLTDEELDNLTQYLNDKVIMAEILTEDEEQLASSIHAFSPDDDSEVKLGDYVDDIEIASASFGYNIYDRNATLRSLDRRLSKSEKIEDVEVKNLRRIWQFDDVVKQKIEGGLKND